MGHNGHTPSKFHIDITIEVEADHTTATARMRWRKSDLVGLGEADLDPDDRCPRRVGKELAVARPLDRSSS